MWVKRTEAEMVEQRRRQKRDHLWVSVLCAVFIGVLVTFTFGWKTGSQRGLFFVPTDEIMSRLPLAFVFTAVVALMIYKWERPKKSVSMICPKCETAKLHDGQNQCACGCSLEKMDEMKWVP